MRVLVAGALGGKPGYGGEAWVRLSWVLGLRALGARVLFVEELDPGPGAAEAGLPSRVTEGVAFFRRVRRDFGLDPSALLTPDGRSLAGAPFAEVMDFAADADLLVNVSGNLSHEGLVGTVRRRAYVDLDPGYTQLWHDEGVGDLRLGDHDVHFTVGTRVGRGAAIPTSGIRWLPVLPPVLLDRWPAAGAPAGDRLTTVASWRGAYGAVERAGRRYGLKAHEYRRLAALPERVPQTLEVALDIHPADGADRRLLEDRGWVLVDPRRVAGTPEDFRDYVGGSLAELSPAQGIYVETASGWFSDRSAHYLSAGRPAVVQDTGLAGTLPVGEGLLTFDDPAGAERAVREVAREPRRHGAAARQIAEEHLDARRVLADFLERALPRHRPRAMAPASRTDAPGSPSGNGRDAGAVAATPPAPRVRPGGRGPVAVSGMVARVPGQGGAAWAVLQYVLGLRALGHDALLVEEVEASDLRPAGAPLETSLNARYFRRVVRGFGLEGAASLVLRGTRRAVGVPTDELQRRLGRSPVLLNLSGVLRDPDLLERVPVRVYVDLDPAFTQLWHAGDGVEVGMGGHTHFATVGLELGRPGCPVPTCGVSWIPFLPPVALHPWRPGPLRRDALTTVAHWRGYGSVRWKGEVYGQKAHAFRELFDLPLRLPGERFEPALAIHPDEREDRDALERNGWRLLDPGRVARTPARYRRFVRGSALELGVAKAGYVRSRCGWFSDRSACYLAAGRPVLTQDTGISAHLPTGEGLLLFDDAGGAAEGVRRIRSDYRRHAAAARRLAEEHLDARRVLGRLLREVQR